MNCNICGKEFDKGKMIIQRTDNGTEYYICEQCEKNGVEIVDTEEYYICRVCGYPHKKDEFSRRCKFCERVRCLEKTELTELEAALLDSEPLKLYEEKFGKEFADNIANWKESSKKEATDIRHKRDRQIDTTFVAGIVIGYILLEMNIRNYITEKYLFLTLLIPTILIIITAPIFKKIDRRRRKKFLPIWIILVIMALLTAIYYIITKLFA